VVFGERALLRVRHAVVVPQRIEHRLLGECVERHLEDDLLDEHPSITVTGFEVLELALDDRVVVSDQMIDVARQGFV